MNKILKLIVVCLGIIQSTYAMEQPFDLIRVMGELPENESIACLLDGKSFSALTQVCALSHAICNRIPTQYLAIDFSDAAEHGNKNLIERFIKQLGSLIKPGIGEEIFSPDRYWHEDESIKLFEGILNSEFQSYFDDYKLRCLTENGNIMRYLFNWENSVPLETWFNPERSCTMYFNNKECNDVINTVSAKLMSHRAAKLVKTIAYFGFSLARRPDDRSTHLEGGNDFAISTNLDSAENLLKKIGEHLLFRIAIEKNHRAVIVIMLNKLQLFHLLLPKMLVHIKRDLFCSQEIKGIVQRAFDEKNMDAA